MYELLMWIVPIVLHCSGFYLLYRKNVNSSRVQRIYLLNLSVCETFMCTLFLVDNIIGFFKDKDETNDAEVFNNGTNMTYDMSELTDEESSSVVLEICLVLQYALAVTLFFVMLFLTVDRFFEIYLNIKYSLYWSTKRSKYMMTAVWIVTVFHSVALTISVRYGYKNNIDELFLLHIHPTKDAVFLIAAGVTYGYIVMKLVRLSPLNNKHFEKASTRDSHTNTSRRSTATSKLLLPSLIILTYIVFMVFPNIVFFCWHFEIKIFSNFDAMADPFLCAGFCVDALLYTVLATAVGKAVLCRGCRRREEKKNRRGSWKERKCARNVKNF